MIINCDSQLVSLLCMQTTLVLVKTFVVIITNIIVIIMGVKILWIVLMVMIMTLVGRMIIKMSTMMIVIAISHTTLEDYYTMLKQTNIANYEQLCSMVMNSHYILLLQTTYLLLYYKL